MAYDEQETNRSRVVVETPTTRRVETRTEREYLPERNGTAPATIAVMVILGVAVLGLLLLLFMNMQSNANNANLAAQQQQPTPQTIIQQPAQQPPIIVQQPAPAAQQAPIIVNQPAAMPASGSASNTPDDTSIQAAIDKELHSDATLSTLDVTASVLNGKVLLIGSVKTDLLKKQVEKEVRSIKGVKNVDNQITVTTT